MKLTKEKSLLMLNPCQDNPQKFVHRHCFSSVKSVSDLKRPDIHRHKELFKMESDRKHDSVEERSYTKIELAFDGNPFDDPKKSNARPSRIYWLSNETLGMNDIAESGPKVKAGLKMI